MNGLFSGIWTGYQATLGPGVAANVQAALAAVAGVLQGVLTFYVLITGYLMLFQGLTVSTGVGRILRAVLVAAALTSANYNQFIVTEFTQTLPNWIAQALGGNNTTGAVQFDQLRAALIQMTATTRAAAGTFDVPSRIEISLAGMVAELALLPGFIIWFLSNVVINVLVPAGPFVLPFLLFDTTRSVATNWFFKLLDCLLLTLFVFIVIQIVSVQEAAEMRLASPSHAGNVAEMIDVLWGIVITFMTGSFMMLIVTRLAAGIAGHGGNVSSSNVVMFFTRNNKGR